MSRQTDGRFPDWEPDEKTTKAEIIYHMDYAHEEQARREGIRWFPNVRYFLGRYTRAELLEIHEKYHREPDRKIL